VEALRDVTFDIFSGEYVAVVGASGSGKSTILNVLGLLDRVSRGRYELEGIDTSQLTQAARSALRGSRLGFVFQAFHLIAHRTLLDNVALSGLYQKVSRRQRVRQALEALSLVGLSHRADFLPSQVSGGERQRAAIARALANQPAVLLADEPTGNLDSANARDIVALFEKMNGLGFTVIIVTHDRGLAARANRRLVVTDGVVGEDT
jgi:putative ABC transport system ATP-binding protein